MGRVGDEKSSGGSASSGLNPQPGEIIFTDRHVAMPKKEIITETAVASARPINGAKKDLRANGTNVPETAFTKSALLEGRTPVFPRKGDIFENPKTGGKIEVEGITEEKGEKDISFTEYNPEGVILHDKRVVQKPKKNFDVAVGVKGMERIDPIKEQHPEFYAKYEGEMAKTEFAFTWESVKIRMRMDRWEETVENIPGNKSGKKSDLIRLHQLIIKIEDAIAKFNELDDRQVNDGRKKMQLFVEMRAFGTEIPSDIQLGDEELKEALMKEYGASEEELKTLEKEHGSEEPNIQLVEEGYQKIIYKKTIERLNKRADQLQKKYDNALVRRGVSFAGGALPATEFGKRVNALFHSINEQSSEKETEKVFADLDELEGQMFEERDEADGNGGREKRRKGKLMRKIYRGGFDREESVHLGRGSEDKGAGHTAGKRPERTIELGETGGFQEETVDSLWIQIQNIERIFQEGTKKKAETEGRIARVKRLYDKAQVLYVSVLGKNGAGAKEDELKALRNISLRLSEMLSDRQRKEIFGLEVKKKDVSGGDGAEQGSDRKRKSRVENAEVAAVIAELEKKVTVYIPQALAAVDQVLIKGENKSLAVLARQDTERAQGHLRFIRNKIIEKVEEKTTMSQLTLVDRKKVKEAVIAFGKQQLTSALEQLMAGTAESK